MGGREAGLGRIHHAFAEAMLRVGRMPTRASVADALGMTADELGSGLEALAAGHGVVLDPHDRAPWVLHPFSATPTGIWVEHGERGWWAPCVWCAFGIAGLAGGEATIHARLGGEREAVAIRVQGGRVVEEDFWVHFAVPPRDAWNNVHRFCATVLPFRARDDVGAWCARHGIAQGETVPVARVWALGRDWYARHSDADWRKWSGSEAAAIFARNGFSGAFWRLPESDDPF